MLNISLMCDDLSKEILCVLVDKIGSQQRQLFVEIKSDFGRPEIFVLAELILLRCKFIKLKICASWYSKNKKWWKKSMKFCQRLRIDIQFKAGG